MQFKTGRSGREASMALLRVRVSAKIQAGLAALLMSGACQEEARSCQQELQRGWGESRSQIINSDKSLGKQDYNN